MASGSKGWRIERNRQQSKTRLFHLGQCPVFLVDQLLVGSIKNSAGFFGVGRRRQPERQTGSSSRLLGGVVASAAAIEPPQR
jgi:hypothetical protein